MGKKDRPPGPAASEPGLEGMLAGIVPPPPTDVGAEVSAGFFHRTLARWLGLPEGRSPGRRAEAPLWDYDFWKAELVDETADARAPRRTYTARVYRTADEEPESYRYWVKLDARGRIKGSGWLTAAPDLLAALPAGGSGAFRAPAPLPRAVLDKLFVDAD
jgi:hypothetical protein